MNRPAPDLTAEDAPASATPAHTRNVFIRGIAWNSAFQVFLVCVNFASMVVLVRVLTPKEYGRATAVNGLMALINCFNCSACISQAIQLPNTSKPDWGAHWRAGFYIQLSLCLVCNSIAAVAWLLPTYRPIAPMLHVISIGLLIDVPNQLGLARLRREMDFRTLRLVHAAATLLTVVSSIALALGGAGAYALIISSNVLHGIPFGIYLLAIDRWRPPEQWWKWPDWRSYRAPLWFGAQQSGSALLATARGLLESLIIPPVLGYEALGLLNRAQVLFTTTIGRVTMLIVETVYPMLPRSAPDCEQFARHATLFVQTMLLISLPGAVFVGMEGPQLSRLLYGTKWIAADPLIWPGTIFAWGVATVLVFTSVLQAQNRLRLAFFSSLVAATLCLPAITVAAASGSLIRYAWALAAGQMATAIIVVVFASPSLRKDWFSLAALPPLVASIGGATTLLLLSISTAQIRPLITIIANACAYVGVVVIIMRSIFSTQLREVILRMPGSGKFLIFFHFR